MKPDKIKLKDKIRILIVDDNDSVRKSLQLILEEKGYEADAAGTGRQALKKTRQNAYNLILLDIKLPDKSGVDLVSPLKKIRPDLDIIMITAYASLRTAITAMKGGASAYILKPLDMDEVLFTIRELINKQRLAYRERRLAAQYRVLIESAAEGILVADIETRKFRYANPAIAKMLGYSIKELKKMGIKDIHPQDDLPGVVSAFKAQISGDNILAPAIPCLRKNGSVIYADVKTTRIFLDDREYALGFFTDVTGLKKAERELRESVERYRSLVQAMMDAVLLLDPKGTVLLANDPAIVLLKKPQLRIMGKNLKTLLPPKVARPFLTALKKVADSKAPTVYVDWLKNRYLETTFSPVLDDKGAVQAVSLVAYDLTDRKRMEESLEEEKSFSENLIESMPDGFSVLDKEGVHVYVNEALVAMTGYSRDELVGAGPPHPYWPEEEIENIQKEFERLRRGALKDLELVFCRKNGKRFPVLVSPARVKDARGRVKNYLATVKDISPQKKLLDNIRQSEEKFRTIFNQAKDAMLIETPDGKIVDANQAACQMMGYAKKELLALTVGDLVPPEVASDLPRTISKETLKGGVYLESVNLTKDGSRLPVEVSNSMVEIGGEKRVIVILRNLSERKRCEEALRKSDEQLGHARRLESIGRIAGGVAHDFNNILMAIAGHADLASSHLEKQESAYTDIEEIKKTTERAADLSRQLLAYSTKQKLSRQQIDLNATVLDVFRMLQRVLGDDVKIVTELSSNTWQVTADQSQIGQVIMNLCINAREAMPKGGTLTVRTANNSITEMDAALMMGAYPGRFVCLSVADTGTGLEHDDLDKIFEPYFTTKPPGEHSGLGLATVYGIIKQHQGWVHVYSEPGNGSIFNIYLPAAGARGGSEPDGKVDLRKLQGRGERLLLVEDDGDVRKVTSRMLRENGYTVFEAPAAQEALLVFEKEQCNFDLVLSDVVLPDQNGIALAKRLLSQNPRLKVLLSSGYLNLQGQDAAAAEKDYHLLKKPYTLETLLRGVRDSIGEKSGGTAGSNRRRD